MAVIATAYSKVTIAPGTQQLVLLFWKTIVIAFFFGITCNAFSALPKISRSSLSNSLQQPTISSLFKDNIGFFWIGTQHGLYRFDGASYTIFNSDRNNPNWIPDSNIVDIAQDKNGFLLVATSDGNLLLSDSKTDSFDVTVVQQGANGTKAVDLLTAKDGNVWILTTDGIVLWDPQQNYAPNLIQNKELKNSIGTPNTISEDRNGNILVGGDLGLAIYEPKDSSVISYTIKDLNLPNYSKITSISPIDDGSVFLGTSAGELVRFDSSRAVVVSRSKFSDQGPTVVSLLLRHQDFLLIATDRGLYFSDLALTLTEKLGSKGEGFINPDIHSLYHDGEYVWIGTSDGLNILSFSSFDLFNQKNSGIYNDVLAFGEDSSGGIWIGTYTGIFKYDNATRSHTRIDSDSMYSDYIDQRITTIYAHGDQLWLGYLRGGVKYYDLTDNTLHEVSLVAANELAITKILGSSDNRDLWIATYDRGLYRISNSDVHAYSDNHSLPENSITALFQSRTGIFLAISENRVYQYNSKTDSFRRVYFKFNKNDSEPIIYSFSETDSDDILVGTKDHGAYIWPRSNQLSHQYDLNTLSNDRAFLSSIIYGIEIDSEQNIWCSTQNGIVKLDPQGNFIKKFTAIDGLQGNDFNFGASFKSREGLIYFGGVNGYNRFDPKEVEVNRSASPMRLTGISLPTGEIRNFRETGDLESLHLTHEDKFVTFQFGVLDFSHPERNRFRYMLENFDLDWIENGTRNTATYTNLPAGSYVFRAQGANSAGIWNTEGISLNVQVHPAPWFSWWAFCIYSLLFCFFYWGSFRIYHSYAVDRRKTRLENEMLEAERRADDDLQEQLELQDELVKTAYQHSHATLSLVKNFISHQADVNSDSSMTELVKGSIKRVKALSKLESCISYEPEGTLANLQQYADLIIADFLQETAIDPVKTITINEISPRLIHTEQASPLAVAMYEILENCFLHAFDSDSPVNYIQLHMKFHEDRGGELSRTIHLTIRDSGSGLPETMDMSVSSNSGLAVVKAIIENLGGTMSLEGKKGTTVTIIIPEPYIA